MQKKLSASKSFAAILQCHTQKYFVDKNVSHKHLHNMETFVANGTVALAIDASGSQ